MRSSEADVGKYERLELGQDFSPWRLGLAIRGLGSHFIESAMCSDFSGVVQKCANSHREFWQVLMNGFPDDLQIDTEVTMRHT